MIPFPHIETPRLILRPFIEKDIVDAYRMNLEPEVTRYTGDGGIVSLAEIERRIKEDVWEDYEKYGFGRWAVEWKENGSFIGFAGLKYIADEDEVDLGFRFKQAYWGQGIATEAGRACLTYGFETLGYRRMIAWVLPENKGSVRVLEKLGFVYEKDIEEDGLDIHQYVVRK